MMKSIVTLIGIALIIFGIITLAYKGFTYTKKEKIAEIGSVEISTDTQKAVYFPPILGGISIVAGIVLVVIGRNSNK